MNKVFLFMAAAAMLSACHSDNEDVESVSNNTMHNVYLTANAGSEGDIQYPVTVYAYSNDDIVAQQMISSSDESISLTLKTGQYTIAAVGGSTDFTMGYATTPLMIGTKDISLTKDVMADISMLYKVASVNVVLKDVREEVTAVSVSVTPQYGSISNKGELGGSVSPVVECTKAADGTWQTGTFYVLPGSGEKTTISIQQTLPTGNMTFTLEYPSPLEAGKPYNFKATYDKTSTHYALNLTLLAATWGGTVTEEYTFGEDGTITTEPSDPDTPTVPDTPATDVKAGTLWNNHIVALVEGNTATLFSTKEWDLADVTVLPTDELNSYSENGLNGWSLPTNEQGLSIAKAYPNRSDVPAFAALNALLEENNLTKIHEVKKNADIRYLCGDGTSAFSFVNVSQTIGISDKSRDYRIRLVKVVTIE